MFCGPFAFGATALLQRRRKPHVSRELARRQRGQSAAVIAIAWKGQERLQGRYVRLVAKGKPKPKAVVAVARELLGFVWAIARQAAAEQRAVQTDPIAA